MPSTLPVTLYIPCYNGARFLDRVLPAVRAQTHPIQEILVVDDGSTDDTAAVAERHGVRVLRHEHNRGLGAARNTGVRAARTEFVACLDADVVARPDWLERLAPHLAGGRHAGACGRLEETVARTLADRWRAVHMHQSWGDAVVEDPEFLFGNNGLFRTEALLKAGLYDERPGGAGDDVTISRKLREAGERTVYDPGAVCDHLHADTLGSLCRTYWNWSCYDEHVPDWKYLRRTGRRARKKLLRRFLPEDLRAGRHGLALVDVLMFLEWRLRDWRRFLGALLRPRRSRSPAGSSRSP